MLGYVAWLLAWVHVHDPGESNCFTGIAASDSMSVLPSLGESTQRLEHLAWCFLVPPRGFEPPTYGLGNRCSILTELQGR